MKKLVVLAVVAVVAAAGAYYGGLLGGSAPGPEGANQEFGAAGGAGRGARGGNRFGGGGQFGRAPLTVETAKARRESIAAEITVVGNLIGQATVAVAPRATGRLEEITVRLGDQVRRGQQIARIEDFEIQEQVKQAEAAEEVAQATIRQREADLQLARTNVERSRNLFERQLLPKQTLDDNEARYQSAVATLDLARAQHSQSKARLDELRINLGNTVIASPVNGFVARRDVDPGAFVSQTTPVVEVVDIAIVRLVANVVEKDLKELKAGDGARVQVDAFPGEAFMGRIARVSPVLDPATRTAPIEVEIPNTGYRLKPGMYARVGVTTDTRKDALVVPANAVIDLGGRRGVFIPLNESAVFRAITVGTEQRNVVEVLGGLAEGDTVITTGAGALRDGDRIVLPGGSGGRRGEGAAAGDLGGEDGPTTPAGSTNGAGYGTRGDGEGRRGGFTGAGRRGGADAGGVRGTDGGGRGAPSRGGAPVSGSGNTAGSAQ